MRLVLEVGWCGSLGIWAALVMSPASYGDIEFWLSSDQDNGCFDCIQPDRTITESVAAYPGEPVLLTMWGTLGDTENLTAISLGLQMGGTQSLEPNAVWIFNSQLNPANTYRHQITLASEPASFVSPDIPPGGEQDFPFCNDEDECAYADISAGDQFGAASINVSYEGRVGVGIGAAAKEAGDTGYIEEQPAIGHPELWKIGLIEFLSVRNGTVFLELYEGDPILAGSPEPFAFYSLDLTVDILPDYNRDGAVNVADYTVWRDSLGTSDICEGSEFPCADGDTNGMVDVMDYNKWKQYFGSQNQNPGGLVVSVPEPGSVLMLIVGIGLLWLSTDLETCKYVCSFRKRCHR